MENSSFDAALSDLLLTEGHTHKPWPNIDNLDSFFSKVYQYYLLKGLKCLVVGSLLQLLILGFTILFSTFLLVFVNWTVVLKCKEVDTCSVNEIVDYDAFRITSVGQFVMLLYFLVFCLYWIWNLFSCYYKIRDGIEMQRFFNERLNVSDEDLNHMEWNFIVDKLVELQSEIKLSIHPLTALDITNRIMREDNYLIALINKQMLNLTLSPSSFFKSLSAFDYFSISIIFTNLLEWNIRICVLQALFDSDFSINSSFLENKASLERRFRFMAIVNIVLAPFLIIFMGIFFFLKNAEDFHSNKSYLGPREWSPIAKWKLREYNELPHFFDERLVMADEPARTFLAQYPSRLISLVAQFVAYISGSFVAVLLLVTLVDTSILLNILVLDRPLWFYLAFFSALVALSRAFIAADVYFSPSALEEVVKYIHYYPDSWKEKITTPILKEFEELYKQRVLVFFQELLSIFSTPFVLFSLADSSEALIEFVRANTTTVHGLGDVCSFSLFDFERNNNESCLLDENLPSVKNIGSDGKMEKSFFTFAINHPNWNCKPLNASNLNSSHLPLEESSINDFIYRPMINTPKHLGDSIDMNANFSQLIPLKVVRSLSRHSSEEKHGGSSLSASLGNSQFRSGSRFLGNSVGIVSNKKMNRIMANADLFLSMELMHEKLLEETRNISTKTKELLDK